MIVVCRVTERCNLSCPFCCYDRSVGGLRREASPEAILRLGAGIGAFQQRSGQSVMVSWLGGEPFLWAPLPELTERFTTDFGLRISATTNGTTLGSSTVRDHVLAHYTELTVSVDRLGKAHDDLRGWSGGFAKLKQAVSALAESKRRLGSGPRLRVNTLLMRQNLGEFSELCDEVAGWGVEEITFNQLGGRDRPEFFPEHRLRPNDVAELEIRLPEIRQRLDDRGVRLAAGPDYLRRLRATAAGVALPVRACEGGRKFLFIDERGSLAPCNYTLRELGVTWPENDAFALERVASSFAEARAAQQPVACEDCHCTQVWEKFGETAYQQRTISGDVSLNQVTVV